MAGDATADQGAGCACEDDGSTGSWVEGVADAAGARDEPRCHGGDPGGEGALDHDGHAPREVRNDCALASHRVGDGLGAE